jgi:serine/threonine-protein kinase
MELLDGETLADRLKKGALPLDEGLKIAVQIADALDAAHRRGIMHRDLKPGNVMLTKTGAKLLDFGLAKATGPAVASAGLSMAPTTPPQLTAQGTILGTFQYMAPEQVEGQETDARTDIFAFGCVLYEMLAGRKAFEGKTPASLVGAILKDPAPRVSALLPLAPSSLDHVVTTCLAKNPDERWQSAADIERELKWIAVSALERHAIANIAPAGRWRSAERALIAGVSLLAGIGLMWAIGTRRAPATAPVTHVQVGVSPAETLPPRPTLTAIALSPDGRTLAFVGRRGTTDQIYIRALDRRDAVALAGTEGAANPFFSPNGRSVGFWAAGALRRVAVDGGPPVQICQTPAAVGATWGSDDTIVFGTLTEGLKRVPASGGTPEELTKPDRAAGEISHRLPHLLPGAKAIVFTVVRNTIDLRMNQIVVLTLATRARKVLFDDGADARYVPSGHLLYARLGKLLAVPFDAARLEVTGAQAGILDDVMQVAGGRSAAESGAMQLTTSETGALAYVPGGILPEGDQAVVWVDRKGSIRLLPLPVAGYTAPRLSPDGRRVAFDSRGLNRTIWIYDLERGTRTALTQSGTPAYAVWTPDGKRIVFAAGATGNRNLFWSLADGSGAPERLTTNEFSQWPASWSPDGRTLLFVQQTPANGADIWALDVGARPPAARPVLRTPGYNGWPALSPDGRWLAYASNESRTLQVYVQPYPTLGARHQVSVNGGASPVWSRDGRQLFFVEGTGTQLFSVDVTPGASFGAGIPRLVLELPQGAIFVGAPATGYDVSLDGASFIGIQARPGPAQPTTTQIQLTLNAFEELRVRAPAK